MAYKEITVENEGVGGGGSFFKFDAIGKTLVGRFIAVIERANNFGKMEKNYTFRNAQGDHIVTPTTNLAMKLESANLKRGYGVQMTYLKDVAQEGVGSDGTPKKPMKIFKVMVDDTTAAPAAAAAPKPAVPAPAPKPPAPAADSLDDIAL